MLEKINKIKNWQAAIIIAVVGLSVYATGLTTPFQGDDILQIVNNKPVHSITNIKLFFEGGTFYNGQGITPLSGDYFRPLMTTAFSIIYSIFGAHSFYFHIFQLLLCIGSAIVLYLFFRFSFKPALALFLSLVFLVHPLDSQVAFAIPSMQDALFFFFGILSIYLLIRFKSIKSLLFVNICLFLSLLAKESGMLFVAMALLYLFWWNRERLYWFMASIVVPVVLWFYLRFHAVGLYAHPNNAPIDRLDLAGRLMTAPSIMSFYLAKFIFPSKLASGYYWVYPSFSFSHVLLPLLIDLMAIALITYLAILIHSKASKAMFYTYIFFAIWFVLGLLLILQIIPLDMTTCETWFYFSMAGLLGLIGVLLTVFPLRIHPNWLAIIVVMLVGVLGLRTATRGLDWRNQYVLAKSDIAASKEDYSAYVTLGDSLISQGKYSEAEPYIEESLQIFPHYNNYLDLGVILTYQNNYPGAITAYNDALKYSSYSSIYDNLGAITLVYGNYSSNKQFLIYALNKFPEDPNLWTSLALLEDQYGDNSDAKVAISNAAKYGQIPQIIYVSIMNDEPFKLNLTDFGDKSFIIK